MLEFRASEALEVARDIIRKRCEETDTASPEGHAARQSLDWIESILAQQGCEVWDPAIRDGKLTSLIELVICG